jgi:hypothetical protein
MSDSKFLRSRAEIPRAIFTLLVTICGLFSINEASQHRILECEHSAGSTPCRLLSQKLRSADLVKQFSGGELQKAIVREHHDKKYTYSEVILVTTQDEFWLTANDNLQLEAKNRITDEINAFLNNSQSPYLRVDLGYNALFWIVLLNALAFIPLSYWFFPVRKK